MEYGPVLQRRLVCQYNVYSLKKKKKNYAGAIYLPCMSIFPLKAKYTMYLGTSKIFGVDQRLYTTSFYIKMYP